ncbi:DNA translocase FtsK [Acinetobacter baumannii]|uniref:DNA translocase FtsK n=1 Tax=Acinetobacter baumannii TaxID=470 RepID=UPI003D006230
MDMELYKSVVDFVRRHNKASTTHIQRAFGLGYNRAAPIMDKLEEDYVVSPMSANGKREVYPEIVAELQQQIKVLTADLKEAQSDFAYAYKSVTSWTERAYKQREKVELIKNEAERFQQSGSPLDLDQFLRNLIQLATFKNDQEFTEFVLFPTKLTPTINEILGMQCFQFIRTAQIYRELGFEINKKAEDEQAFFLFKFLHLALEHGDKYLDVFNADTRKLIETSKSGAAE